MRSLEALFAWLVTMDGAPVMSLSVTVYAQYVAVGPKCHIH